MENTGCYESVIELVNEATNLLSGYALNQEKRETLGTICETIDKLICELESFECVNGSIDDTTKRLSISILCDDAIFQHGRESVFFTLIKMLSSFSFSKAGYRLQINLNIDGLWEKKHG